MQLVVSAFYGAKLSVSCSYLIAASAKILFKPPQTCQETMVSCFFARSIVWISMFQPCGAPGGYCSQKPRDREEGGRIISRRGHELTPPRLVEFCSWLKSWCITRAKGMASCQIKRRWTVPADTTAIKRESLPCFPAPVCLSKNRDLLTFLMFLAFWVENAEILSSGEDWP